jgi:hypothetical protein
MVSIIENLYNKNENINVDHLPPLPESNKNYIITNERNYSPFQHTNLSLAGSSTNKAELTIDEKKYNSISRKCKGCFKCTNMNCNSTRPTSINKLTCHKCKNEMILTGSDCQFKIYHLKEKTTSKIIQHILITTDKHNHTEFPIEWRNKDETSRKIEKIIIENPNIKPSNDKIKNLQINFNNKDNLNKVFYKNKKKVFGSNQSVFSIGQYESKYFDCIDASQYDKIYNGDIINWLKPSVASFGGGLQKEMEYYFTIFPPLGVKLLSDSTVLHIDVKHKRRNENQNDHHLGILIHLENFDGILIDINCFVCDIFISHLTKQNFNKSFLSILEVMESYGIDVVTYIQELELIVSDFSQSQREGIEIAINTYLAGKGKKIDGLENKFSGCKFHFMQSVKRLKNRLNDIDKSLVDKIVVEILNVKTIVELKMKLNKIKLVSNVTDKWVNWWLNEKILNLLFGCLTNKVSTNNNIESSHSNFFKSSTSVQNYHELMNNFKKTYVKISTLLNNKSILTYATDLKRKRFMSNLNKFNNKNKNHHQDKSGNPPLPKIKKMTNQDKNTCNEIMTNDNKDENNECELINEIDNNTNKNDILIIEKNNNEGDDNDNNNSCNTNKNNNKFLTNEISNDEINKKNDKIKIKNNKHNESDDEKDDESDDEIGGGNKKTNSFSKQLILIQNGCIKLGSRKTRNKNYNK